MVKLSAQLQESESIGRLTRTERQIEQRRRAREIITTKREFEELQARAKDVQQKKFSNIRSIEEYREIYNTLDPELQQFFQTPTELTTARAERIAESKEAIKEKIEKVEGLKEQQDIAYQKSLAEVPFLEPRGRFEFKRDIKQEYGVATASIDAELGGLREGLTQLESGREISAGEIVSFSKMKAGISADVEIKAFKKPKKLKVTTTPIDAERFVTEKLKGLVSEGVTTVKDVVTGGQADVEVFSVKGGERVQVVRERETGKIYITDLEGEKKGERVEVKGLSDKELAMLTPTIREKKPSEKMIEALEMASRGEMPPEAVKPKEVRLGLQVFKYIGDYMKTHKSPQEVAGDFFRTYKAPQEVLGEKLDIKTLKKIPVVSMITDIELARVKEDARISSSKFFTTKLVGEVVTSYKQIFKEGQDVIKDTKKLILTHKEDPLIKWMAKTKTPQEHARDFFATHKSPQEITREFMKTHKAPQEVLGEKLDIKTLDILGTSRVGSGIIGLEVSTGLKADWYSKLDKKLKGYLPFGITPKEFKKPPQPLTKQTMAVEIDKGKMEDVYVYSRDGEFVSYERADDIKQFDFSPHFIESGRVGKTPKEVFEMVKEKPTISDSSITKFRLEYRNVLGMITDIEKAHLKEAPEKTSRHFFFGKLGESTPLTADILKAYKQSEKETFGAFFIGELGKGYKQAYRDISEYVTYKDTKLFARKRDPSYKYEPSSELIGVGAGVVGKYQLYAVPYVSGLLLTSPFIEKAIVGRGALKGYVKAHPIETALITTYFGGRLIAKGIRVLRTPTIKTVKIKAPKISIKASEHIVREQKILFRTTLKGETKIIEKVIFKPQRIQRIGVAGRRTVVSTKFKELLKLDPVYKGVPTAEIRGYQKALRILTERSKLSEKVARGVLRYHAPRVVGVSLTEGHLFVAGGKAVGEFSIVTQQPVLRVSKILGIKTRGARTIRDIYNIDRKLVGKVSVKIMGKPVDLGLVSERIRKTTMFVTKKGGGYNILRQAGKTTTRYTQKSLVYVDDVKKMFNKIELQTFKGDILMKKMSEKIYYPTQDVMGIFERKQIMPLKRKLVTGFGKTKIEKAVGKRLILDVDIDKLLGVKKDFFMKKYPIKKTPLSKTFADEIRIEKIKDIIYKPPKKIPFEIIDDVTSRSNRLVLQSKFAGTGMYERTSSVASAGLKQSFTPTLNIKTQIRNLVNIETAVAQKHLFGMGLGTLTGLRIDTLLKQDLKSDQKLLQELDLGMDLKAEQQLKQLIKQTQVPAQAQALKLSSAQILKEAPISISALDPALALDIPIFFKPPIFAIPIVPFWFPTAKSKAKKKVRDKLLKQQLAYLPDFTARALGLEPEVLTKSQALKQIKKIQTGLEIRRAVKLIPNKLLKGIPE